MKTISKSITIIDSPYWLKGEIEREEYAFNVYLSPSLSFLKRVNWALHFLFTKNRNHFININCEDALKLRQHILYFTNECDEDHGGRGKVLVKEYTPEIDECYMEYFDGESIDYITIFCECGIPECQGTFYRNQRPLTISYGIKTGSGRRGRREIWSAFKYVFLRKAFLIDWIALGCSRTVEFQEVFLRFIEEQQEEYKRRQFLRELEDIFKEPGERRYLQWPKLYGDRAY